MTSLVILCVSAAERQTVSFGRSEKPPPPPRRALLSGLASYRPGDGPAPEHDTQFP